MTLSVDVSSTGPVRARTIVTADPELDDLNSMIRFLLYANELDVEGLIYASSRFHWLGDGKTPFFLPDREYTEPQLSWRWAQGERFIDDAIDAYEQVHPNLLVHDSRYPSADALRAVVRMGNVEFEGDVSEETPGSQLIAETLLDDDDRPVHLQVWAGTSTIARALMSIEERFAGSPEWPAVHAAVSRKAVITKFASQDGTYDSYIRPVWPDIRVTDVATMAWGYLARVVIQQPELQYLGAEWMRENVTSVGPLGALYRTWGDGRQMVPGDFTDYFHLSGQTADELRELGYAVWVEPQPLGEWISEGDTTTMLNLLVPGLRGHEHPGHGGWGGRARRVDDGPDTWETRGAVDARAGGLAPDDAAPDDAAPNEAASDESSVTRWFADAQNDFAARLQWSVRSRFDEANHAPVVMVDRVDLEVRAGERVMLSAAVSDPDGDSVSGRWWQYREAGSYAGHVVLTPVGGATDTQIEVEVEVPGDAVAGQTIHLIAEAVDDGVPALKGYQRVILTVV
ncbi:DUF1593 domain-containing protein [Agreia pratensis]|uniref:DUF1593 domain-containing protein n=1 Tax=Agreia pratensis TaxID=150121 RepID=UPI00188CE7EE|nr:DUF1593 domain-containing protein [Agreia pratensis]MBF4635120.1 DUF1593 domain-containing protein [Agreia pratensis]